VIVDTLEDRAAARAGAGAGMTILAVNGRKYSIEVLDAAIVAAQASKKPIEIMVENGDYYRVLSVPYFDGPRWPHLTRLEAQPDVLAEVLKPRVN
jgi:predicted HAD superfamily phosphohydrolase